MNDDHAEGHGNGNRKRHADYDQVQMIRGRSKDFGAMLEEESPGVHACAPLSGARDAVKARTSGCSMRGNSSGVASATMRPPSSRIIREARSSASRRS